MNIQIIEGTEGAKQAKDIAIIIDVLRAATVSAYLLNAGVNSIVPVSTSDEAFDYKKTNPDVLLVGEDKGIKIPGFDIGNSPSEIKQRNDLQGKQVIHRSSTGTQGLVNAQNAQQIIFWGFCYRWSYSQLSKESAKPKYNTRSHVCSRRSVICRIP